MSNAHDIILRPVLTEKTYQDMSEKRYAFIVHPDANRTAVKQAIEEIFNVEVAKVNIVNTLGKIKRQGLTKSRRASLKKAYVVLKETSAPIEFFEGMAQ